MNEKLIERLRAVIDTGISDAYTAASQMNVTAEDHASTKREVNEAETVRDLVIAALEAAEKAHTPTDDERGALLSVIINAPESGDALHVVEAERVRDAVLSAGFRRSEAPQDGFCVCNGDSSGGRMRDCGIAAHRAEAHAQRGVPEPQGEPSDAQARAERAYAGALYPDIAWERLTNATRREIEVGIHAALRAAGEVRS